jgi:hypothetical protein
MKVQTYFIAKATCIEMKAFDGSVITKEGTEVLFGMSEGYPSLSPTHRGGGHRFASPEEARRLASKWDGMPWYYRLKNGSLRVFKVTERTVHEFASKRKFR